MTTYTIDLAAHEVALLLAALDFWSARLGHDGTNAPSHIAAAHFTRGQIKALRERLSDIAPEGDAP